MTRLIIETSNDWTREKVKTAIDSERLLLERAIRRIEARIKTFETQHGELTRESLYGKIDDMELLEWEGEIETLKKLREQHASLQEITIEYQ